MKNAWTRRLFVTLLVFDVVSSQGAANNVLARKAVNQGRGVSPP